MLVLITYDVSVISPSGRQRLVRIAKICEDYGQRVQNSVFECDLSGAQLVLVRNKLLKIMDQNEDSIRIYNMGNKAENKVEHYGTKETYDPEGSLLF